MNERELVGAGAVAVLFLLIMLRVPVALAMIGTSVGGAYVLSEVAPFLRFGPYLSQFTTAFWNIVSNYDLSVVPLFILMGFLASEARLSHDLFHGLNALVGRLRGGVAIATIAACAGFGAVSGSSLATASTMAKISLPELRRLRYQEGLATGVLAAGGTLGILIPPSVALVIYAIVVEASIIEMFQAAVLPGLLAVIVFMIVVQVLVARRPEIAPRAEPLPVEAQRRAVLRLIPVLAIFGAMILGLGLGLFTPTPAASVGAFIIALYGLLAPGRTLRLTGMASAVLATAKTAGMIYLILFAADMLKGFFARTGLPATLSTMAGSSGLDPYTVILILLLVLILLGCFMESLSMILVVVPFFWPILVELNGGDYATAETAAFGMDNEDLKIWFGILALVVVELGLITPPVGLNVFVIKSFAPQTSMGTIFRGVFPFFLGEVVRVGVLILIPSLCLLLPTLLRS
ncbi:MAG: TRAP transporter large permease [Pseudomonadota bacterium]